MADEIQPFEIGGAKYFPNRAWSMACELWMMRELRRAGLDQFERVEGETPEALIGRITLKGIESGAVLLLLGGFLLPEGARSEDWTPAMAEVTAAALGRVVAKDDKTIVSAAFATMLIFFFQSGLVSLKTSPSSSNAPPPPPAAPVETPAADGSWTDATVNAMASGGC